jgi:Tfp pilus assembly protein PilF
MMLLHWARLFAVALAVMLTACGAMPERLAGQVPDADVKIVAAPVSPEVQREFDQGIQSMQGQNWADALVVMESLWEKYPWLSGPALNAALICQQLGQLEEAEQWYMRAIESNGDNLEARNEYAIFLRTGGRYREAQEQYRNALALFADYPETHYNLGILYDLYLGEKDLALQHFSRYQQLTGEEDRKVAGWIADLQRQLDMLARAPGAAT